MRATGRQPRRLAAARKCAFANRLTFWRAAPIELRPQRRLTGVELAGLAAGQRQIAGTRGLLDGAGAFAQCGGADIEAGALQSMRLADNVR